MLLPLLLLLVQMTGAAASWAQQAHESLGNASGISDVPPGAASIVGKLLHPAGSEKTEGSRIVLYSLAADGSPGVRTTLADGSGVFRFEDLSSASGITYLVGASYQGIPYGGKRVSFEPGQSEIALVIDVDEPSADTSDVSVGVSSLRVEWIGASLGIEEIHQLDNSGEQVIFVAPEKRSGKTPPFRVTLPPGAEQLDTNLSGVAEGYEVRGDELIFWGPIYADGLELRFRYQLPIERDSERGMTLRWRLDSGSSRATLLYPQTGPTLFVAGAATPGSVTLGERPFRSLDLGAAKAGASFDVAVSLPEMSNDRSAISLPRADIWLDADDTFLQVNFDLNLVVAAGAHLTGSMQAPLLRFELPPGAELRGYNQAAQGLGLVPLGDGTLGLLGPLSPGEANVGFSYRLPVADGEPQIDLRLPGPVKVLNVLIADTGVVVKTKRLHRLRPFRQGTRVYLHREAFSIDEGEVVSVSLGLINRGSRARSTNLFATSALAAMGVWFIVSPLVRGRRIGAHQIKQARIRSERDLVYASIRDLEHDFETAKIEEAEYQTMRTQLRTRALTLLQEERDASRAPAVEPGAPSTSTPSAAAAFCHQCGNSLKSGWQFCPKCGASQVGTSPNTDGGSDVADDPVKANP